MGVNRWLGGAISVAQVTTVTIGTYDATTTYKVTINNKTISQIGTGGTNATTATALQALLAASTEPEFQEVTWTVNSNVITGTAVTAGKPFTLSTSVSGGTGTISNATTTTSSGPEDWSVASNWSLNAVPVASDDVYIDNNSTWSLKYGLSQSGVTLNSLNIAASFTKDVGLPNTNTDSSSYAEYRATFLAIGATTCNIGYGDGSGSGRLRIDFGSVLTTVNVTNTGATAETGIESCLLKGTNASNVVNVLNGTVAVAPFGGNTSTVATLRVASGTVRCGAGTTLTTVNIDGGTLVLNSAATTITLSNGNLTIYGTGAVTTLTINSGTAVYNCTGTITTLSVSGGGSIDFSQDLRGRTVTNCNLYQAARYIDTFRTVTATNGLILKQCGIPDVSVDAGENLTLTLTYN